MAKYLVVLCLFVAGALSARITPRIAPTDSWRIVGGNDAPEGAYPYQISLRNRGSHSCGGSIVGRIFVITAAHCVVGQSASSLTVVAGTNKLSSGGVSYKVLRIISHEDYDSWDIQNDVAILHVEDIEYNDLIAPIAAGKETLGGDLNVTLTGWGRLSYPGTIPDNLQHINLKTTTAVYCKSRHSTPVIDSQICTLTKEGEGACHGDSGGPLVQEVAGVKELVGIVSWGRPCARGYPDVFSRVSSFLGWFNDRCGGCLN